MTISELIERLEALKAEHGDLPVAIYDEVNGWGPPEMQTDRIPTDKSGTYMPVITMSSW